MIKTPIYLDNNSTTPIDPRVLDAMLPYFQERFGNPSSNHSFGWMAKSAVENSRELIAKFLSVEAKEIIFTSGATEAINLSLLGFAEANASKGKHIISSNVEHSAAYETLNHLSEKGFDVTFIKVDKFGSIDPQKINDSITDKTTLVSLIYANNEIGTINDIKSIGEICKDKNVILHVDATQAIGKIRFTPSELNIDLMSFTAHKFYGPKGIGALFLNHKNPKTKLAKIFFGGDQENSIRPGTLNVPSIVGLGKAIEICSFELEKDFNHSKNLRDRLLQKLFSNINGIYLNGAQKERLPNNLNFYIENVKSDKLMLELRDLAFSNSSACSAASTKPSRILKALGLSDEQAFSTVRFGIGRFNTIDEIDYAADRIIEAVNKIRVLSKTNYTNQKQFIS